MQELGRFDAQAYKETTKFPITWILDNVRSGLNVGSIFRSADAFGMEHIICVGYTPTPPHREVLKTALGSAQTVSWSHQENITSCIEQLKAHGYRIFALEQVKGSVPLHDFFYGEGPIAVIVGNEVSGVSQEALDSCDGCIEIEQYGTKHSLNVAVSTGIAMFALRQR